MTQVSDQAIYEQNYQEFRSLNGFFWQIPLIMMTLNGGLWYSVASLNIDPTAKKALLWFSVAANVVMIFGLWRLRGVMGRILHKIAIYEGRFTEPERHTGFIQILFSLLLGIAAAGAAWASLDPEKYFPGANQAKEEVNVEKE